MGTYVVKVLVVDKKSGKGLAGHSVKHYGGDIIKTDSKGMAAIVTNSSSVTIYVNGVQAYNGSVSNAPKPIIYEK